MVSVMTRGAIYVEELVVVEETRSSLVFLFRRPQHSVVRYDGGACCGVKAEEHQL